MVPLCGPCACSTAPWSHSTSTWPRETLWCATAPKTKPQRPKSLCTCKPSASFHFLFLFFVASAPMNYFFVFFLLMWLEVSRSYFCIWVVTRSQRWQSCPHRLCRNITLINYDDCDFWVFSDNVLVVKETVHNGWPTFHVVFISRYRCGAGANIHSQLCCWRCPWELYFLH